ncbi:hypothetical protein D3C86_1241590 [compost metagenome]
MTNFVNSGLYEIEKFPFSSEVVPIWVSSHCILAPIMGCSVVASVIFPFNSCEKETVEAMKHNSRMNCFCIKKI